MKLACHYFPHILLLVLSESRVVGRCFILLVRSQFVLIAIFY